MPEVQYDPFSVEAMADPYPVYRELRAHSPIHRLEQYDAWALSRFDDVWEVIGNADAFTIVEGPVFERSVISRAFDADAAAPVDFDRSFATWDPPGHTAIRRAMSPHLRPRVIGRLEADVRAMARTHLEAARERGRLDVAREYTAPVSVTVACRVLGLPDSEAPGMVALVNRSARREPGRPGMTRDGFAAQGELHAMVASEVARRRKGGAGPPGVIEALLELSIDGDPLDDHQVATQLVSLLVGGTETLPKVMAGGVFELHRHPEQRATLAAEPRLAAFAFEEFMRHQGVLQSVGRTALRDVSVGSTTFRRGERVFLLLQSANRDEREFPDAESFDIHRRPERHLALGQGPHFCVGAHVARLEGRVLVEELLGAISEYDIDASGIERPPSDFQIGYTAMPITFSH